MRIIIVLLFTCLLLIGQVFADGGGTVSIGYQINDEDGNLGVNEPTFNSYEGVGLSIEDFRYQFTNGIRVRADMNNITLNNRNLNFGLERSGLFGVTFSNNQYRRTYDFDGAYFTRRHTTMGTAWFSPNKYVKIYAGGKYIGKSGNAVELFDLTDNTTVLPIDYKQKEVLTGVRFLYEGRMLQAEYRDINFDSNEDQKRYNFKLLGIFPVPRYEWVRLFGGFRRFETKYTDTDFKISSNRGWGGVTLDLPKHFGLKYSFIFDRTSSDSDYVATDHITHTVSASYSVPGTGGATIGYQNGIKDDYENEIGSNAYYFSGWLKPLDRLDVRTDLGVKYDEVNEGYRLTGDQDQLKHMISVKYRFPKYGNVRVKFDSRTRENDNIGSETDFNRFTIDGSLFLTEYGYLTGGYSYAKGSYENSEQKFEFSDNLIYCDMYLNEFSKLTLGAGIVYYRSMRDLDLERINLRFSGEYRLPENMRLELVYNVHNFDDLYTWDDQYYTANIVNINLKKDFQIK